ncbi:MAG: hypothetical protein JWN83_2976 [Chitinophagaceae bacterium]|nr:hypothetical protein [Chitinophagaceae bacterium]
MKKQFFLLGAAAIFGFAACNDNGTTTATTTDTTATNPGDTTIQTTTTTTTTTKTVHPIANFERRTFYNVVTHKPVKLRMDTVLHYYVDVSTNQEPTYYYYDPATKDTFDYWGRVLNNALINNNGDYTVDETRLSSDYTTPSTDTVKMSTDNSGKMKMKAKDDKTKVKTKDK